MGLVNIPRCAPIRAVGAPLMLLALLSSCSSPAGPGVTSTRVTITGTPTLMPIGDVVQLTALDPATQQPVQATWSSSD